MFRFAIHRLLLLSWSIDVSLYSFLTTVCVDSRFDAVRGTSLLVLSWGIAGVFHVLRSAIRRCCSLLPRLDLARASFPFSVWVEIVLLYVLCLRPVCWFLYFGLWVRLSLALSVLSFWTVLIVGFSCKRLSRFRSHG